MRIVSENAIETMAGAEADAKVFARKLRGHFPCFLFEEWNGSFHAADYQIVAESDLSDTDQNTVAVSVNSMADARNAFLMLHQERLERVRSAFKNSREY